MIDIYLSLYININYHISISVSLIFFYISRMDFNLPKAFCTLIFYRHDPYSSNNTSFFTELTD